MEIGGNGSEELYLTAEEGITTTDGIWQSSIIGQKDKNGRECWFYILDTHSNLYKQK